jgi:hypothetical protein
MYVPLDVNFPDDEKIEAVGFDGAGLYVMALCIAKRTQTDGRLTRVKLLRLGATDVQLDALVASDLVRADGPDHVIITAWLDHNDSADEIAEKRAADALRKRRTRGKRPNGHGETSERTPPGVQALEVEVEVEVENTSAAGVGERLELVPPPAPSAKAEDTFPVWWDRYPRKLDKAEAAKAYRKALARPRVTHELLLSRLGAQVRVWRAEGTPADKTPYAATWLNKERWADEHLTAPERDPRTPAETYGAPVEQYR